MLTVQRWANSRRNVKREMLPVAQTSKGARYAAFHTSCRKSCQEGVIIEPLCS